MLLSVGLQYPSRRGGVCSLLSRRPACSTQPPRTELGIRGVQVAGKRPWLLMQNLALSSLSLVDEVLLGVEQRILETLSSSGELFSLPLGINTECGFGFQAAFPGVESNPGSSA